LKKLAVVLLAVTGCAKEPTFALPMTAAELATYDTGPALVAYLGQPDASAAVCDGRARGPHVGALVPEMQKSLVRGLVDGKIAPDLWLACADTLVKRAQPEDAASFLDETGRAYKSLVKDSKFETTPAMQERVVAMQKLYVERKNRVRDGHDVLASLFEDLRAAIMAKRIGPIATSLGTELLDAVDLERGMWKGKPVTAATLDGLDEPTLRLFVARLPSEDLRTQAKRSIVRRHIDGSPFPEVHANADDVEERVLIRGSNPVELDQRPAKSGAIDPAKIPMRNVIVRQDLYNQSATLLGTKADSVSILPDLSLRDALSVDVGMSRAVTICAPKKDLDPSPCIAATDVKIQNPLAYLDAGVFRFVDRIPEKTAVDLVKLRDRFELPVEVGGTAVASLAWPFRYERPAAFVLAGRASGENGPKLVVKVDHRDARFVYDVSDGVREYWAVTEAADAPHFVVASRGAQGYGGEAGTTGSSGSSGGECGNGGDGGPGGPGGDGGTGGNGGDVDVELRCDASTCADALAVVKRTIGSVGGAGGSGGPGGSGGSGGAGGSGRSPTTHTDSDGNTVTDDPGCSGGTSGSNGSDGPSGSDGAPGRPGRVTFRVTSS
jgi:hypothetical protein